MANHPDQADSGPPSGALWAGVLIAPVVWLVQFEIRYVLVPWCCAHGHVGYLRLTSVAAVVGALLCVGLARHNLRRARGAECDRFMAVVGLLLGCLFLLLILAQALPDFFLNPCQK